MQNIYREILERKISSLELSPVLAIPGILHQETKPIMWIHLGKAWIKTARNGRIYFKIKFHYFKTSLGKTLYAKAWIRKLEPRVADVYLDERDGPIINLCPFMAQTAHSAEVSV